MITLSFLLIGLDICLIVGVAAAIAVAIKNKK